MDEQNITLRIAGKEYPLRVKSPEAEQVYRLAAEDINNTLSVYNANYPDKSDYDKMVLVCLGQAVSKITVKRTAARLASDLDTLDDELGNYLAGIEKNR
ncbi:MAG: cell division protein ZapA [Bacteroidales bacterium]|nr:cell division protein ZapA [Bacteroidales bacterium]